ncbi:MAG: electron transfer flavoprotein subunit alpha [Desulfovibrionaceae bacterium]|nr:electron transfer flavoprotein subunit alpha [Desulfovibrionaceae bacterium]
MEKVLFLAHNEEGGGLSRACLEALSAARDLAQGLGAELAVGLFGGEVSGAAEAIGGCGAACFLAAAGPVFASSRYASDAAACEALCRASGAGLVVAAADSRLSRVLPGVAQRLGGRIDTHLTGLWVKDGSPAAARWFYRQRMVAEFTRSERPWLMSVESGCFEAFDGPGAVEPEPVAVDLSEACKRTEVLGLETPSADEQTIRPDAELLFVAGAGWTKKQADGRTHVKEAEGLILDFLNRTKASLGSSKSLVDISGEGHEVISYLTHLHQVGQTGATPRHPKGLAACCHGEEPHVVGWRFIGERRAINLDAGCGWAQGKADVLYVADAFEVLARLNELLARA